LIPHSPLLALIAQSAPNLDLIVVGPKEYGQLCGVAARLPGQSSAVGTGERQARRIVSALLEKGVAQTLLFAASRLVSTLFLILPPVQ